LLQVSWETVPPNLGSQLPVIFGMGLLRDYTAIEAFLVGSQLWPTKNHQAESMRLELDPFRYLPSQL